MCFNFFNKEKMAKNEIEKIFDFLKITEKLKQTKRWLNTKTMKKKESTADHSWSLALLTLVAANELSLKIDSDKAIKIALAHDLVEAIAGDTDQSLIFTGKKTAEDKNKEEIKAMKKIKQIAPEKSAKELSELWREYEEAETPEARFVKALDKIEGINHMLCKGHDSFDIPELIAPFPRKAVLNFPATIPLYEELLVRLKPEFEKNGWEWKKEYDINS